MKKYKVICMSFDGEYVSERPTFETIDDAWNYANDLGSKWFFYPFVFVISGQSIADAPERLEWLKRRRISTVKRMFNRVSQIEEAQGADVDDFIWCLMDANS